MTCVKPARGRKVAWWLFGALYLQLKQQDSANCRQWLPVVVSVMKQFVTSDALIGYAATELWKIIRAEGDPRRYSNLRDRK